MSTIGYRNLLKCLNRKKIGERLIITPLLDLDQVGDASVDIRLGNDFTTTRRGNIGTIDPAADDKGISRYQGKYYINFKEKFHLHPNELVLASSLEYFRLPKDVSAVVTSRSSWGRAGLVIATATAVHPGYTGSITLELLNLGEVPLVLYPGLRIAQMIFSESKGATVYEGQFKHQTDARYANLHKERDKAFWIGSKEGEAKHTELQGH